MLSLSRGYHRVLLKAPCQGPCTHPYRAMNRAAEGSQLYPPASECLLLQEAASSKGTPALRGQSLASDLGIVFTWDSSEGPFQLQSPH